MRYSGERKYPITHLKKEKRPDSQESVMDLSLGAAVGILAMVFAHGFLWGYMVRKWRS